MAGNTWRRITLPSDSIDFRGIDSGIELREQRLDQFGSRYMVLILFYYRKSNWSARLRTSPFLSCRYPRTRGFISRFHRSVPAPVLGFRCIQRSEYKSRPFSFASSPDCQGCAIITINEETSRYASSVIPPPTPYILLDA